MIRTIHVREKDGRITEFVSKKLDCLFYPPFFSMGIEKNGEVIAGVVLNCYESTDVHMTIAGTGWNKTFLGDFGTYLFYELGVERVTALTEQEKVVKMALRLGGQVEGILRNHFGPQRNAIIIGILKDEYRF